MAAKPDAQAGSKKWQKSTHTGLVKYVPTGGYYAVFRVAGKLRWTSLKTKTLSVAILRLGDLKKKERAVASQNSRLEDGTLTLADAAKRHMEALEHNRRIKSRTKAYYAEVLKKIRSEWLGWDLVPLAKVTKADCLEWAKRMAGCSPSVFNHSVGLLRKILNVGVESGVLYVNPAQAIPKAKISQRRLILPGTHQFASFVASIEGSGSGWSKPCADLVRFLAFGGFRKAEAANITWRDIDFAKGTIRVSGDPVEGTKNREVRNVPIIEDMEVLLKRLRSEQAETSDSAMVMQVRECQRAMDRAAKAIGMPRITHHDLRHLFATRCIEAGVDIPTVSRWLGHKDGGALAMRVYGHLRDEHSTEMAKRVSFSAKARS